MKTVIKNGVLLDNENQLKKTDIEFEGRTITKIGDNLPTENRDRKSTRLNSSHWE